MKLTSIVRKVFIALIVMVTILSFSFTNKVNAAVEPVMTSSQLSIVGAGVRTTGKAGIRFAANIGSYDTTNVTAYGIALAYGEINKDNCYIDGHFVVGGTLNGRNILNGEVSEVDSDGNYYITIYNIPDTVYLQDITARAYVVDNGAHIYGNNCATRNLAEVAFKAINDGITSDLIENVKSVTFNQNKKVYKDAFNNLVIDDLYESDFRELKKTFIIDINRVTGTTLSDDSTEDNWIVQLDSCNELAVMNVDVTDSKLFQFFDNDNIKTKWTWLLDFIDSKEDADTSNQIKAIKGDGTVEGSGCSDGLNNLHNLIGAIYNFFYNSNSIEYSLLTFNNESSYVGMNNNKIYSDLSKCSLVKVGDNYTFGTNLNKNGYSLGISLNSTNYNINDTYQVTASNVKLDLNYTPIQYTISYVLNGGTNPQTVKTTYTIEDTFTLPIPTKDSDYIFTGWTFSGQDKPIINSTITNRTGNLEVSANWYAYSDSGYGYNSLVNNDMKNLYKQLLVDSINVNNNKEDYTNSVFTTITSSLTEYTRLATIHLFKLDHPEFYWIDNAITTTGSITTLEISSAYLAYANRLVVDNAIQTMVDDVALLITQDMSELKKTKVIHDYIINKIDYAYKAGTNTPEDAYWAHNLEGVALERGGVCEAYAEAFDYLLEKFGIESILVSGNSNKDRHLWNLVNINDKYYYFDTTWDDAGTNGISYRYFGTSADYIKYSHSADTSYGFGIEYLYDLPEVSTDDITLLELFKDDNSLGLYGSVSEAFEDMTDEEGDYTIKLGRYDAVNSTIVSSLSHYFILPGGNWPTVNSIAIVGDKVQLGTVYYAYVGVKTNGDITLNSNLELCNLDIYEIVDDSTLNIQNYCLTFSGSGGRVYLDHIIGGTESKIETKNTRETVGSGSQREVSFSAEEIDVGTCDLEYVVYLGSGEYSFDEVNQIGSNGSFILQGNNPTLTINDYNCYYYAGGLLVKIKDKNATVNIGNVTNYNWRNKDCTINVQVTDISYLPTINITGQIKTNDNGTIKDLPLLYSFTDTTLTMTTTINGEVISYNTYKVNFANAGDQVILTAPNLSLSNFDFSLPGGNIGKLFTKDVDGNFYREKDFGEEIVDGVLVSVCSLNSNPQNTYTIPSNVTTIGGYAFQGYMNLTEVIIPSNVTTLQERAFNLIKGIKELFIPSTVINIPSNTFYGNSIVLLCEVTSKPSTWADKWYGNDTNIVWGSDGTVLDNGQFKYALSSNNNASIISISKTNTNTDIVIPNTIDDYPVIQFMNNTFMGNSGITSIYIPNTIVSIPERAFQQCSNLTSVTFEANSQLAIISASAFNICKKLTSITIPESVTFVGGNAFGNIPSIVINVPTRAQTSTWASSWNSTSSSYHITVVYLDEIN